MPKIKLSALATDMKGKSGGSVFSRNKGGVYFRNNPSGGGRKSNKWDKSKSKFGSLASKWKKLTALQRDAWNNSVSNFPTLDAFGESRNPSGYELFMRLNGTLVNVDLPLMELPPEPAELPVTPDLSVMQPTNFQFAPNEVFEFVNAPKMAASNDCNGQGETGCPCSQDADCVDYEDMCLDGECVYVGGSSPYPPINFDPVGSGALIHMRLLLNKGLKSRNINPRLFPLIGSYGSDDGGKQLALEVNDNMSKARLVASITGSDNLVSADSAWFPFPNSHELSISIQSNDVRKWDSDWNDLEVTSGFVTSEENPTSFDDNFKFTIDNFDEAWTFFGPNNVLLHIDSGKTFVFGVSSAVAEGDSFTFTTNLSNLQIAKLAGDQFKVYFPNSEAQGPETFTLPSFESQTFILVNGVSIDPKNMHDVLSSDASNFNKGLLGGDIDRNVLPGSIGDFRFSSVALNLVEMSTLNLGYVLGSEEILYKFASGVGNKIENYGLAGSDMDITMKTFKDAFGDDQNFTPISKRIRRKSLSSLPALSFVFDGEIPDPYVMVIEVTPPTSRGRTGAYNNFKRLLVGFPNIPANEQSFIESSAVSLPSGMRCEEDMVCPPGETCMLDYDKGYCVPYIADWINQNALAFGETFGDQPNSGNALLRWYLLNTETGQVTQKKKGDDKKESDVIGFKAGAEISKSVN